MLTKYVAGVALAASLLPLGALALTGYNTGLPNTSPTSGKKPPGQMMRDKVTGRVTDDKMADRAGDVMRKEPPLPVPGVPVSTTVTETAVERVTRIGRQWLKILGRLEAFRDREQRLYDRIASRLEKFAAQGVDVKAAQAKLTAAKVLLAKEAAGLETLRAKAAALTQPLTREALQDLRKAVMTFIDQDVKPVHRALVDIINSIKPGQHRTDRGDDNNGTSTNP